MAALPDYKVSPSVQPKAEDYDYDLDSALASMVALRATVPADAFTAETLGTERAGNGVVIRDKGVVLTIGYLITEADSIWLHFSDGRVVPGHALGYDQETGFGLVQPLARLDLPGLPIGQDFKSVLDAAKKHLQLQKNFNLDLTLQQWEKGYVEAALMITQGNLSQAAKLLGIHRTTLYSRMQNYGTQEAPGNPP